MLASLASLCDHELSAEERDAHMGRLLVDLADVRLGLDLFSIEGTPILDRLRAGGASSMTSSPTVRSAPALRTRAISPSSAASSARNRRRPSRPSWPAASTGPGRWHCGTLSHCGGGAALRRR